MAVVHCLHYISLVTFLIMCSTHCVLCVTVSLTQTKKKGLDLKKKLVQDVSIVVF